MAKKKKKKKYIATRPFFYKGKYYDKGSVVPEKVDGFTEVVS